MHDRLVNEVPMGRELRAVHRLHIGIGGRIPPLLGGASLSHLIRSAPPAVAPYLCGISFTFALIKSALSSVLCPLSSVLCPLSSVLCLTWPFELLFFR
jgi:hypothetical protein